MNEEWKDAPGFAGYQVSNHGRVCSYVHRQHKGEQVILNPGACSYGYRRVNFTINGKLRMAKVHRLVALAFIPNPLGLPEVNHKSFNKDDNSVENLEWVTSAANKAHYLASGTESQRVNAMPDNDVLDIRACAAFGASVKSIAHAFGLHRRRVERILSGQYYSHI